MTDLDKARANYERERDARAQHRERACDRYIAALEAENEALKCCGNCGNHDIRHDPYGECEEECDQFTDYGQTHDWPEGKYAEVQSYDPCHFTPSRWQGMTP